jgi:Zn-dependent peptidase ImmA (M78 family)
VADVVQSERINPDILKWARETAGLSVEEAAERLGLKDSARETAIDKLNALETGERSLSQTTLERAVSVYRRPLITFYMARPPRRGQRATDFRSHARAVSKQDEAILDALVRDVKARQHMLRDLLEDTDQATSRTFVGSATIAQGARAVASIIREEMNITIDQQLRCKDADALFSLLRMSAEERGVYVLLLGNAGSWHSAMGEDVFRGFALADDIAPMIVINDNDAKNARPFTLMHELVHIWLGQSGISGPLRDSPANAIETFCNDTASEFLLPSERLEDHSRLREASIQTVLTTVQHVAATWNVSEPAVAYRMVRNGWIADQMAGSLFAMYAKRWSEQKQRDKAKRQADESGPSYYVVRRYRLGAALLDVVRRALQENEVSYTGAGKILGVGPASVPNLLRGERAAAK